MDATTSTYGKSSLTFKTSSSADSFKQENKPVDIKSKCQGVLVTNNDTKYEALIDSKKHPDKLISKRNCTPINSETESVEPENVHLAIQKPGTTSFNYQKVYIKTFEEHVPKTQLTFEQQVDDFLSTPFSYFNTLDENIKQKQIDGQQKWVGRGSSESCKLANNIISHKFTFNNILTCYLKQEITADTARKRLILLDKSMNDIGYSGSVFMEQIILLKRFKLILDGGFVSDREKLELTEALCDTVIPSRTDKDNEKIDIFTFDLMPLQIFMYFNCLPTFSNFSNYEKGFMLLFRFPILFKDVSFLFTPVSFTPFDRVRINTLNKDEILYCLEVKTNKYVKFQQFTLLNLLHWIHSNIQEEQDTQKFIRTTLPIIKKLKLDIATYMGTFEIINTTITVMVKILMLFSIYHSDTSQLTKVKSSLLKQEFLMGNKKIPLQEKSLGEYETFYILLKIFAVSELTLNPTKKDYMLVANLYKKASTFMPSYMYNVYYYYKKAGLWHAAAAAADEYAKYCEQNSIGNSEFWKDEAEQLLQLNKFAKKDIKKIRKTTSIDFAEIDSIIKDIEEDKTIDKSLIGKHKRKSRKCKQKVSDITSEDNKLPIVKKTEPLKSKNNKASLHVNEKKNTFSRFTL